MKRDEFIAALTEMTGLPAARLKAIINESLSSDAAANAVVLAVLENDKES